MRIHSKISGTKGLVSVYNEALRFRDMITPHADLILKERARILSFWQKHGDAATKEAYGASRTTLFRWQKMLKASGGKLAALVPKSTAPKVTLVDWLDFSTAVSCEQMSCREVSYVLDEYTAFSFDTFHVCSSQTIHNLTDVGLTHNAPSMSDCTTFRSTYISMSREILFVFLELHHFA